MEAIKLITHHGKVIFFSDDPAFNPLMIIIERSYDFNDDNKLNVYFNDDDGTPISCHYEIKECKYSAKSSWYSSWLYKIKLKTKDHYAESCVITGKKGNVIFKISMLTIKDDNIRKILGMTAAGTNRIGFAYSSYNCDQLNNLNNRVGGDMDLNYQSNIKMTYCCQSFV
jgi:hypothetical protein